MPGDVDVLATPVPIGGAEYRVRLLDMSAVPVALLGETVLPLAGERDAVLGAIDVILHGYPIGRPH
nr:hypothetical protein [uncultured Rhodopila sp.]